MPRGHTHHAREVCRDCGAFLRWLPSPGALERQRFNLFKLSKLVMLPNLTGWERGFIRDVSQRKKLSPQQQQILDRLAWLYLEGTPGHSTSHACASKAGGVVRTAGEAEGSAQMK